jgi:recombination associated protein RdgC
MSIWFKNLVVYRLPVDWSLSAAELETKLSSRVLRECGSLEMFNRGWMAPAGAVADDQRLVQTANQQLLISLGSNQKLLPGSIIKQETQERAKALEQEQGFPVGRRQLREVRDRVTTELRARALTRRKSMRAWIDPINKWFVVESASIPRAEELVETLRDTLGSFAVVPLETEQSPQAAMGTWLQHGDAPGRFVIDQDLELQAVDKTKATIRYVRHPLEVKEIKTHLSSGKYVTRLGLTWNDRISFVLTDKLQIKRVDFLEMAEDKESAEEGGAEISADEKFTTDFLLMSGELSQLLKEVFEVLGGANAQREAA